MEHEKGSEALGMACEKACEWNQELTEASADSLRGNEDLNLKLPRTEFGSSWFFSESPAERLKIEIL